MAAGFGTTTEEMQRAGKHVLSVNESVQAELSALRGQLASLQGAWRGEAAGTFTQLMVQWDTDARAINEALRGIGEAIQGSAMTYQQHEDQQAGDLSAIRAALG
ncbi:WXG100 family type VII secretion target [Pseudonocardia sp. GCM10023141]|uniref:WXG100 family type VII secretion target n=1 Tax=Pseudonocardia sp. GCM10023141 TaxID=3252653 RepID=UPI00361FC9C8